MIKIIQKKCFGTQAQNLQEFFGNRIISTQYDQNYLGYYKKELHFSQAEFQKVEKYSPESFQQSPQLFVQNIQSQLSSIKNQEIKRLIFQNPQLPTYDFITLKNNFDYMKLKFGYTEEDIIKVITGFPQILYQFQTKVQKYFDLVFKYTYLTVQDFGQIILNHPFFLQLKFDYLEENLKTMRLKHFSKEELITVLKENSECMAIRPGGLKRVWTVFYRLDIRGKKICELMIQYPQLLTLCPSVVQHRKISLLLKNKIPLSIQKQIFLQYPELLVKSLGSLQLKIKYLKTRLRMDFNNDIDFPAILMFNYDATIRPRGEAMLKTLNKHQWKDIVYLTDEEFCSKINFSYELFLKLKEERKVTKERDNKLRFYSKRFRYSRYKRL